MVPNTPRNARDLDQTHSHVRHLSEICNSGIARFHHCSSLAVQLIRLSITPLQCTFIMPAAGSSVASKSSFEMKISLAGLCICLE